ncbi:MAG: hypothetical protein KatS3mg015_1607 [Fimbriimonadales bacterium]|nr:MAG: hypothetical protein KatS3mg015_1607 [Fimbriimonadales bacterium]
MDRLIRGNDRFVSGTPKTYVYGEKERATLCEEQKPIAAVVACSDSRVAPEIVFDQPLGALFVSRVPGNVAAESTVWAVDLAVDVFEVPLVVVMGHTGCLAVASSMDKGFVSPWIQQHIGPALNAARSKHGNLSLDQLVEENARHAVQRLLLMSTTLRNAVKSERVSVVPAVYDMATGKISLAEE